MWYDTSDGTSSDDTFEIDCAGSGSSSNTFFREIYKNGAHVATTKAYNFTPSPTSDMSGVYQCGIRNSPNTRFWVQKTTNVMVASMGFNIIN